MEQEKGHLHPMSRIIRECYDTFKEIGFEIAEGPEVETEYYNFDTLNIPKDHPARDLWDTFWLKPVESRKLLRTHTSPVQVRYMEKNPPPIKIIAPGKVFRQEATDATHEAQFYQLEGLVVDEKTNLGDLKGLLKYFFDNLLGEDVEVRFRPSYFPFVEPGVEVDIKYKDKWLELMGAGMVHPKVLQNVGINTDKYQGFAFGMGLDRLAMLKYNIPDVRMLYTGDLRFVNQF